MSIIIVDYKMGNLGSIANMLKKVGYPAQISDQPDAIRSATKLILPGVGAFDTAMQNIAELELAEVLRHKVLEDKVPILGVCLGMQLFANGSEEGQLPGLGWIDAKVVKFDLKKNTQHSKLRIPHMGWNFINIQKQSEILKGLDNEARFYFVHSYHFVCQNEEDVLAKTFYGYDFVSMVKRANIIGAQFHPEKSHRFGMTLYRNFAEL